jgi:hypothetical protein
VGGQGSAKSRALLMEGFIHGIEYPGTTSIILRKTIPDLKRTVIAKFKEDIPREMYERYHETDRTVMFHPVPKRDENGEIIYRSNGDVELIQSKLRFDPCANEKDAARYLSTEFVFIGFEELGEFSFGVWDALGNRNRVTNCPGARPCMAGATNPFGPGWSWIRKLWVLHQPLAGMDPLAFEPNDYEYFHSTVLDNPILANDVEYVRKLMSSPNRKIVFEGDLNAVSGDYFENYVPELIERDESEFIFQPNQPVWIGWDYGFQHFAVIIFMTKAILKASSTANGKPRVVNVILKELILQQVTPENQAAALIAAIPRLRDQDGREAGYKWEISDIHFSWERFTRTSSQRTIADDVGDVLSAAGLPRPQRSNTDRVAGWTKMYRVIEAEQFCILKDQAPTCCEAIPQLPRDDKNIEDVKKPKERSLYDDVGDATRYAMASVIDPMVDKSEKQKYEEKIAATADPMARFAIQYREWNRQKKEAEQAARPRFGGSRTMPSWMARLKKPK